MGYRIERCNSDSGRIRIARLKRAGVQTSHFKPIAQAPEPPIRVASEPAYLPHVALLSRVAEDRSPAARARRATRRLRRLYEKAERAAKGQARLRRTDEYELLQCAFAAFRCWQQNGIAEEIERELRAEAEVAIGRASSLYLVFLRSALPGLDAKRASKWAGALQFADHHRVRSKRLAAILYSNGGIEGAAHARAILHLHQ